jgi:small subunit ribosomal protein S9
MSDETPRDEDQQDPAEETAAPDPVEPEAEGVTPEPGTGTAADDVAPAPEASAEEQPAAEAPEAPAAEEQPAAEAPAADAPTAEADDSDDEAETPRVKPAIPGADLEVDIVMEGSDPLDREDDEDGDGDSSDEDALDDQPVAATIDLAADARYRATGKRKTAVARVILRPGTGAYTINGKPLDDFFPRPTLQRNIRQPLEAVGYETRMDVIARMHGGGVSSQAGALRHGISRALLEADPNLRGELKRRGFLTRDARAKERKKAGLKKARKRPQFSKR